MIKGFYAESRQSPLVTIPGVEFVWPVNLAKAEVNTEVVIPITCGEGGVGHVYDLVEPGAYLVTMQFTGEPVGNDSQVAAPSRLIAYLVGSTLFRPGMETQRTVVDGISNSEVVIGGPKNVKPLNGSMHYEHSQAAVNAKYTSNQLSVIVYAEKAHSCLIPTIYVASKRKVIYYRSLSIVKL